MTVSEVKGEVKHLKQQITPIHSCSFNSGIWFVERLVLVLFSP